MTGVVVAGTGFGCFTHVRALRNAGFDVRAIVGRDPDKTAARAKAFDVPYGLTSFAEALAHPGIDAATVATPPDTHAELVTAALEAGKHILCEKPFATDSAQAERLHDAAERSGLVHLLGTEFRFDTGQALLARAVAQGAIGEPRLAMFLLHVPMLVGSVDVPAWWADAGLGGGWLGAHASQVIDQVRCTLGEFASVTASLAHVAGRSSSEMSADDGFVVHFRLRSGPVGVMQSTAADWGPPVIETRVVGTEGTAWIEGLGDHVCVTDVQGTRRLDVPAELRTIAPSPLPRGVLATTYERMIGHGLDLGPYTRLADHFLARITGAAPPGGPQPATFADGVADMAVLDAVRRAAAEHRAVEIANLQ